MALTDDFISTCHSWFHCESIDFVALIRWEINVHRSFSARLIKLEKKSTVKKTVQQKVVEKLANIIFDNLISKQRAKDRMKIKRAEEKRKLFVPKQINHCPLLPSTTSNIKQFPVWNRLSRHNRHVRHIFIAVLHFDFRSILFVSLVTFCSTFSHWFCWLISLQHNLNEIQNWIAIENNFVDNFRHLRSEKRKYKKE